MSKVTFEISPLTAPQIGLVVLQSDETIERDMRTLMPEHVDLLISRVPSGAHVTEGTLTAIGPELRGAAALFPPSARFRAVGYGCTSGTAQIGVEAVATAIAAGTHTDAVTEPVSALIAACTALSLRRIGLLSPYIEPVSARLRDVLTDAGITVVSFASFEESSEAQVARIVPASVFGAAMALAKDADVDALFISCTNLRTLEVVPAIEDAIARPVLSSNLVLAWDLLRRAGVRGRSDAPGRLWASDPGG